MTKSFKRLQRIAILAIILALAGSGPDLGHAEVVSKTTIRDHPVRGVDAASLVVSMYKNAIARKGSDVTLAMIEPDIKIRYRLPPASERPCRLRDIKVHADFRITLPKAVQSERLDRATARAWKSFHAFVKKHEYEHRTLLLACAGRIDRRAARLSAPTCGEIEPRLAEIIAEETRKCAASNEAFDRREAPRVDRLALFELAERQLPQMVARLKAEQAKQYSVSALLLRRTLRPR